jgi:hypothetical protein
MATPVLQQSTPQSTPPPMSQRILLDHLLKYAVIWSALAYAAGYQIEANYRGALRIPWEASGSDTPFLLYTGSYSLLSIFLGAFAPLLFSNERWVRFGRHNITATLRWGAPAIVTFFTTQRFWSEPVGGYNIVRCTVLYLASAYLFALALHIVDVNDIYGMRGFATCLFAAFVFLWAASYEGTIYAQSKVNQTPNTRLLLKSDAAEFGSRGLLLKAHPECLVSEPTSIAAVTHDAYYVILPNSTTIAIQKEKVIGTIASRTW